MKKIIFLISIFPVIVLHAQVNDSIPSEKKLKDKILTEIQNTLDKKNVTLDSTIKKIDYRIDNIDSLLKTSTNAKERADKLLERVQIIEDKQKALEENELNIYQANYQSAIINLLSIEREIKPLLLFNATKNFFTELSSVSNPLTYSGYQEWFKKFKLYVQKNKKNDFNLRIADDFITLSESVSATLPITGAASQMMFTGMSSYINSMKEREKELKQESEKMFSMTMALSQFTDDKDKIEYEWDMITQSLKGLQTYYDSTLNRNLASIGINKDDFISHFSKENDADKRYLYLTNIRQKMAQIVSDLKSKSPKEWKEMIHYEMADVQALKLKYGDVTFQINHHINQYEGLIKKYEKSELLSSRMELLETKLTLLKETFDKAFDPSEYTNSVFRMYKSE